MKAVVLASGRGSRMGELTDHQPKALIPIAGRPLIVYSLLAAKECGITSATIILGYPGDPIKDTIWQGASLDMDIDYVHQLKEKMDPARIIAVSVDAQSEVLGLNCDALIAPREYQAMMDIYLQERVDGCILLDPARSAAPTSIGIYGPRLLEDLRTKTLDAILEERQRSVRGYIPRHMMNVNDAPGIALAEAFVREMRL